MVVLHRSRIRASQASGYSYAQRKICALAILRQIGRPRFFTNDIFVPIKAFVEANYTKVKEVGAYEIRQQKAS